MSSFLILSFTRKYCICNLTLNTANKYSQIKRDVFFQLPQHNCYLTIAWISRGAPHTSIQTLCKHQHHDLTQAELSLTSVKLQPINLPEGWHEAAHSWRIRLWWGWGQVVSNRLYCEKLLSECTTYTGKREHCLSVCVPLVYFVSASSLLHYPLPSSSTMHAEWAHGG